MKSLYDTLHVNDPEQKTATPVAPTTVLPRVSAKTFAKDILNSPQYRQSLLTRILMGELPAQVECLLYHYAYGKPVERVEVEDKTKPVEDYTPEMIEKRAMDLLKLARKMKSAQNDENDDTQDQPATAVH